MLITFRCIYDEELNKVIKINSKYTSGSYIWVRSIIKHEISHAISSAVLPHKQNETYVQPGRLNKENIRDNYKATGTFLSFDKIRKAGFKNMLKDLKISVSFDRLDLIAGHYMPEPSYDNVRGEIQYRILEWFPNIKLFINEII